MIDAIHWVHVHEGKPVPMERILIQDNKGFIRVCDYYSDAEWCPENPVEFYVLIEPREYTIPPADVVRWSRLQVHERPDSD